MDNGPAQTLKLQEKKIYIEKNFVILPVIVLLSPFVFYLSNSKKMPGVIYNKPIQTWQI